MLAKWVSGDKNALRPYDFGDSRRNEPNTWHDISSIFGRMPWETANFLRTKLLINREHDSLENEGMNQRTKIAIASVIIVGGLFSFLFAPVVYLYGYSLPVRESNRPYSDVYESLGCMAIGIGDIYYSPGWNNSPYSVGLHFTCTGPPPLA
jgi:hypothetical protein